MKKVPASILFTCSLALAQLVPPTADAAREQHTDGTWWEVCTADDVACKEISGGVETADVVTFDGSGNNAPLLVLGASSFYVITTDMTMLSHGADSSAITLLNGANVAAAKKLTIVTDETNSHGVVFDEANTSSSTILQVIGALDIETKKDASYGIKLMGSGRVIMGADSIIKTAGAGSYGIYMDASGNTLNTASLTVKDRLDISTEQKDSSALYATDDYKIDIGEYAKITTKGDNSHGIFLQESGDSSELKIGERLTVKTSGDGSHGLYFEAGSRNNEIGETADITTSGRASHGIVLYDNATADIGLDLAVTVNGEGSTAIYVENNAELETGFGVNITLNATKTGGVYANEESTVTIGDHMRITSDAAEVTGVESYEKSDVSIGDGLRLTLNGEKAIGLQAADDKSSITVGKDAQILTKGKDATALHAWGRAEITIGEESQVRAEGANGMAIVSSGEDTTVTIGANSKIAGDKAAVSAVDGGAVELKFGEHHIQAANHAFQAYGESGAARIKASGKFTIYGDIAVRDSEKNCIDIALQNDSVFTGRATVGLDSTGRRQGDLTLFMSETAWYVRGSSNPTTLKPYRSTITFDSASRTERSMTLTVGTLQGDDTTFIMDMDDQIIVTEPGAAKGTYGLTINTDGGATLSDIKNAKLVQINGGDAAFEQTQQAELGGRLYDISKTNDGDLSIWRFVVEDSGDGPGGDGPGGDGPGGDGPGGNGPGGSGRLGASASAFVGSVEVRQILGFSEVQTMLQRLGDLRDTPDDNGIWAKVHGGQLRSESHHSGAGRTNTGFTGIQFGYDHNPDWFETSGNLYIGIGGGYTHAGVSDTETDAKTDVDRGTVSAYATYMDDGGTYADMVVRYVYGHMDIDAHDILGNAVGGSGDTHGFDISLEIGHRLKLDGTRIDGLYIEPQLQATYMRQGSETVKFDNGLRAEVDSYGAVIGRIGLNIGREVKTGDMPYNIYAKGSFNKAFADDLKVHLNDTVDKLDIGESWWTFGVGGSIQLAENHTVYADVEGTAGGRVAHSGWKVNLGYRYTF